MTPGRSSIDDNEFRERNGLLQVPRVQMSQDLKLSACNFTIDTSRKSVHKPESRIFPRSNPQEAFAATETVDSGMKIDAVEGKKYISLLELEQPLLQDLSDVKIAVLLGMMVLAREWLFLRGARR
jgi:hypothetical protein